MRQVVFFVRCHGESDEETEQRIMNTIADIVENEGKGWGVLTIGRQYFHDNGKCNGHPDAKDECEDLDKSPG